jgi:hypothetical protein
VLALAMEVQAAFSSEDAVVFLSARKRVSGPAGALVMQQSCNNLSLGVVSPYPCANIHTCFSIFDDPICRHLVDLWIQKISMISLHVHVPTWRVTKFRVWHLTGCP